MKGLAIQDLEMLADLEASKYWDVLHRLFKTKLHNIMVMTTRLSAIDPNLAINKSNYDGQMMAIRKIDKLIAEAGNELNKVINAEKTRGKTKKASS